MQCEKPNQLRIEKIEGVPVSSSGILLIVVELVAPGGVLRWKAHRGTGVFPRLRIALRRSGRNVNVALPVLFISVF